MAESPSSARKIDALEVLTVMEMSVVQHLMQLSNEDNNYSSSSSNNNNNNSSHNNNDSQNSRKKDKDDEVDQLRSETTRAKIEEIFGKEGAHRSKKRRYRSLVSIYTATKPINGRHGKKVRS